MKHLALVIAVAALAGCAANPQTRIEQTQVPAKPANRYEKPAPAPVAVVKVPDWFIQPPENTAQSIFSVGESTGTQLGMVMQKAMLDADAKLAFQMKSQLEASIKSFKTDTGGRYGAETAEMLARKITSATITGHHKVDSQITQEGNVFRVFVLMRYPLGEANRLLEAETASRMARTQAIREARAGRELSEKIERQRQQEVQQENREAGIVEPAKTESHVEPVVVPSEAKTPEKVSSSSGQSLQLLDVDNEEYKRRRAEALQKPGAVVGQITVR